MGYDAKVRLGRQGTSKRDALVQVPEVHEGAGPVAGRVNGSLRREQSTLTDGRG